MSSGSIHPIWGLILSRLDLATMSITNWIGLPIINRNSDDQSLLEIVLPNHYQSQLEIGQPNQGTTRMFPQHRFKMQQDDPLIDNQGTQQETGAGEQKERCL